VPTLAAHAVSHARQARPPAYIGEASIVGGPSETDNRLLIPNRNAQPYVREQPVWKVANNGRHMMTSITAGITAAAMSAGIAVGATSAAWAGPPTMNGTYDVHTASGDRTWIINPCGSGCVEVNFPEGGGFQANLTNGRWTGQYNRPDAVRCPTDGGVYPGTNHIGWDANTLQGSYYSTYAVSACGWPAGHSTNPDSFTLMKLS
jgi:hypothetical protein